MTLETKISTFIGKALTKAQAIHTDLMDEYDFRGYQNPKSRELLIKLSETFFFVELLKTDDRGGLTNKEISDLIDFFIDWLDLDAVIAANYINYFLPVVNNGDGDGSYATAAALAEEIAARIEGDAALLNRIITLEESIPSGSIFPDGFFDLMNDDPKAVFNDDDRLHTHANKELLDQIDPQDITNVKALTTHFGSIGEPGGQHVSAEDRERWNNQPGSQTLQNVLVKGNDAGGARIVNLADPIDPQDVDTKAARDAAIAEAVTGIFNDRGNYDASVNTFPASGGSGEAGAIKKGDIWTISVAGTLGAQIVAPGDTVRALIDDPGQTEANWAINETNIGYTPENAANKASNFAIEDDTKYPTTLAVANYVEQKLKDKSSLVVNVAQIAHGLVVGDFVTINASGQYVRISDPSVQKAVGVVIDVPDVNNVSIALSGYVNVFSGLTQGEVYYIQPSGVLGADVTAIPALIALTATSGFLLIIGGGANLNVFTENFPVLLSSGKSFGKYVSGQTVPAAGKTPMEVMIDAAFEFLAPTFSSFNINVASSGLEVGATLNGVRTFTWGMTNTGNYDSTDGITIKDQTNDTILVSSVVNDGSEGVDVGSVQKVLPGSHTWRILANDLNDNEFFRDITVNWNYYAFRGSNLNDPPENSDDVRGGSSWPLNSGNTFSIALSAGQDLAWFAYPATRGDINNNSVKYIEGFNSSIGDQFQKFEFNVNDAGGTPVAYKVWICQFGAPFAQNATFTITLPA